MSRAEDRKAIYCTGRWRRLRREIMDRDDGLCQDCLPVWTMAKEVHHVRPIENGGDPWDPANLVSLCRQCHRTRHSKPSPIPNEWESLIRELSE